MNQISFTVRFFNIHDSWWYSLLILSIIKPRNQYDALVHMNSRRIKAVHIRPWKIFHMKSKFTVRLMCTLCLYVRWTLFYIISYHSTAMHGMWFWFFCSFEILIIIINNQLMIDLLWSFIASFIPHILYRRLRHMKSTYIYVQKTYIFSFL